MESNKLSNDVKKKTLFILLVKKTNRLLYILNLYNIIFMIFIYK